MKALPKFPFMRRVVGISIAVVAALLVSVACQTGVQMWTACAPAADGNPTGTDGTYVLACRDGRWVPLMTVAEFMAKSRGQNPTIAPLPTAANDLAAFFSAAQQADQRLKAAATAINGDITGDELRVDPATADAVRALGSAVAASAAAIPAGLEPDLLRAVLLVQSDLASRSAAMSPAWSVETKPMSEVAPCLRNGCLSAARYPADLAALRSLADTSPPVTVAAPDSRAAEELAVRLTYIDRRNNCANECGSYVATDLREVTFYDAPTFDPVTGHRWDGIFGDVVFRADFEAGTGWRVEFNAC